MGNLNVCWQFVKFSSLLIVNVGVFLLCDSIVLLVVEECAIANGFSEMDFEMELAFPPVESCEMTFGASEEEMTTVGCIGMIVRAKCVEFEGERLRPQTSVTVFNTCYHSIPHTFAAVDTSTSWMMSFC